MTFETKTEYLTSIQVLELEVTPLGQRRGQAPRRLAFPSRRAVRYPIESTPGPGWPAIRTIAVGGQGAVEGSNQCANV